MGFSFGLYCRFEKRRCLFGSLSRNCHETRIMLNQMLLLRRLNNYNRSAWFSSPWNGLPSKQQNATIKYIHARPLKPSGIALLPARVGVDFCTRAEETTFSSTSVKRSRTVDGALNDESTRCFDSRSTLILEFRKKRWKLSRRL